MNATILPFVPKQDPEMPDSYGMKVFYIDGKEESFEIVRHGLQAGNLSFTTQNDLWQWITMSNVKRIEFDQRFSKIMALKERKLQEQQAPQAPEVK